MNPQGSKILNTAWFDKMVTAINKAPSCEELTDLVTNKVFPSLSAENAAINAELVKITPFLTLLTPPTSPNAAVTWISNFITLFLTPVAKPYETYTAQLVEFTVQVARLTAAIESAQAKFVSCSVPIPPV